MSHESENDSLTGIASDAHSTAADSPMRRTLRLLRQTAGDGEPVADMGGAVVGLTKEDIDAVCPGAGDEYVKAFMTRIEWIRAAGEVLGLQMPSGKDMASRGRCIEILASYYKELNLEALRTAASDPSPVSNT